MGKFNLPALLNRLSGGIEDLRRNQVHLQRRGSVGFYFAPDNSRKMRDVISPAYSLTPTAGTTYSITLPLQSPNQANVAGGYPINGLNFQIDPANVSGDYTITFNSIEMVPEPTTFALAGLGIAGLLAFRRNP